MTNDRDDKSKAHHPDSATKSSSSSSKSNSSKSSTSGKRVIGEGMTSLDSTQVPLKSSTGEPDWDAVKGGRPKTDGSHKDDSSNRR